MSQELSQPSEHELAPPAAQPAVTGMHAESNGLDAPGTPEDTTDSRVPAQPGAFDSDEPDTPGTSGAFAAPGASEYADSRISDTTDPSGEPDAFEASDQAAEPGDSPADDDAETPDTPVADGAADTPDPVLAAVPDADQEPAPLADPSVPGAVPEATGRHSRPADEATGGPDGPLLGDMEDLQAGWQQILAGFVDDPLEAVAAASNLIEQTAQALAGALQQRQQQLRATWDRGSAPDGTGEPAAAGAPDTERLRQMIRQYKALFNQISRL